MVYGDVIYALPFIIAFEPENPVFRRDPGSLYSFAETDYFQAVTGGVAAINEVKISFPHQILCVLLIYILSKKARLKNKVDLVNNIRGHNKQTTFRWSKKLNIETKLRLSS